MASTASCESCTLAPEQSWWWFREEVQRQRLLECAFCWHIWPAATLLGFPGPAAFWVNRLQLWSVGLGFPLVWIIRVVLFIWLVSLDLRSKGRRTITHRFSSSLVFLKIFFKQFLAYFPCEEEVRFCCHSLTSTNLATTATPILESRIMLEMTVGTSYKDNSDFFQDFVVEFLVALIQNMEHSGRKANKTRDLSHLEYMLVYIHSCV